MLNQEGRSVQESGEAAATPGNGEALSEQERTMLRLEAKPFKYAGAKQEAIRALLNMSATAYYQRLNRLIDSEAALAYHPALVLRLRAARPDAPGPHPAPAGHPRHQDEERQR